MGIGWSPVFVRVLMSSSDTIRPSLAASRAFLTMRGCVWLLLLMGGMMCALDGSSPVSGGDCGNISHRKKCIGVGDLTSALTHAT